MNPAHLPEGAHRFPFKYVEVLMDEDTGVWLVMVFDRRTYDSTPEGGKIQPMDAFSGLDEVTALSRAKKEHPYLVIAKTSGECKVLPL